MQQDNQNAVHDDEIAVESKPSQETIDHKAEAEKLRAELDKIKPNYDKLYKETKDAKKARDEALAAKALKDGEYETLWKQAQTELEAERNEKQQIKKERRQDKIEVIASRLTGELAEGNNAVILNRFVMENLDKLADEHGVLDVDVLKSVRKDFETNSLFKGLLKGSKASGGDAPGNTSGKQAITKELSRAEFDKLDHEARSAFFKAKGKLTD
tara:strand:+ start:8624 stop:9262 length:639 start_codon:yes stop_codon:yes gene_type:complete